MYSSCRWYSDTENENDNTETHIPDTNDRCCMHNVTETVDILIMGPKHNLLCKELHINYNTKDD